MIFLCFHIFCVYETRRQKNTCVTTLSLMGQACVYLSIMYIYIYKSSIYIYIYVCVNLAHSHPYTPPKNFIYWKIQFNMPRFFQILKKNQLTLSLESFIQMLVSMPQCHDLLRIQQQTHPQHHWNELIWTLS